MNILYIGDIMGDIGFEVVRTVLPDIKKKYQIDVVIAQAENLSEGKGTSLSDYRKLLDIGIDFCTGGNWTLFRKDIYPALSDKNEPIIRPANYPSDVAGKEYKILQKDNKKILVVSLLGQIVGKQSDITMANPLLKIDQILNETKNLKKDAVIINFHGDFSSEKVIIGAYLDGRATAVIGDHWHVPTADARILPKGTAHLSDVGMCGVLNASLGVSFASVIPRWRDSKVTRNVLEAKGPRQFNAVVIATKNDGLARSITQVQMVLN